MRQLLLQILLLILIYGCDTTENNVYEKPQQDDNDIEIAKIIGDWKHSYEEETDSLYLFRPADFKEFPSSWYRHEYKFYKKGICSYLNLHPLDAHYFEDGFWSYDSLTHIVVIKDSSQELVVEFRIVSLTEELLKYDEI